MATVNTAIRGKNGKHRRNAYIWEKQNWFGIDARENRGWFAVTIAGFVSVMVVIISALSGADMGGFFGVVGSLIKWATFVFIPLYILFSVPAAIDFFQGKTQINDHQQRPVRPGGAGHGVPHLHLDRDPGLPVDRP